jgi:putative membrane protein
MCHHLWKILEKAERVLVLAVDRDDDLGRKGRVATPVSGREAVIAAAMKLALADPEEADANAMFATVKSYDELKAKGVNCEVAVVCGTEDSGFDADKKIRREVESLLTQSDFSGIVVVSDGGDDEHVIPILQTMKPILSVKRVVVKYSKTVEETYLVLGRYLRMLIFDPRYSKWVLGVPGLLLLLAGVLVVSNRVFEAQLATLLILGGAFFIRGFNIDRSIANILSQRPYGYIRLFSIIASILVILVGISSGFGYVSAMAGETVAKVSASPSLFLVYGTLLFGYFLKGSLLVIWIGIAIYSVGALLAHLVRGSVRAWRDLVLLVILALLYLPMDIFSTFLIGGQRESTILLISYVLVGLAVIFGISTTLYSRIRTRGTMLRE